MKYLRKANTVPPNFSSPLVSMDYVPSYGLGLLVCSYPPTFNIL